MKYMDICTMDAQGRVVIPTKIRRFLNLVSRDCLEVELAGQEIRLRKCGDFPTGTRKLTSLLTILYNNNRHTIALCSDTQVITAVGGFLPDGTPVSKELSEYIKAEKELFPGIDEPLYISFSPGIPIAAIFPIYTPKPLSLVILSEKPLSEVEIGCARLVAATIKHEFI